MAMVELWTFPSQFWVNVIQTKDPFGSVDAPTAAWILEVWRGSLPLCRDWSPTFPHSQELLCGPMLKDRARIVVLQPESVSWSKKFLHFAGCWRVSSRDEKLKQVRRRRVEDAHWGKAAQVRPSLCILAGQIRTSGFSSGETVMRWSQTDASWPVELLPRWSWPDMWTFSMSSH